MIQFYLDPGTGSVALQLILAGLAAIGLAFRPLVNIVRRVLKKQKATPDDEE